MRLANARLADGTPVDVQLAGGRIAAIAAPGTLPPLAGPRVDLDGALLLPAFIDAHIHLDKTQVGTPLLPHVAGTSVGERVAAERRARHAVPLPVAARATTLVGMLLANGTTRVRSHVDVDNDIGLAHVEILLGLRQTLARFIDIELVAFPQSGVVREAGAADLLDAALAAGCDLVGGLDPLGFDGDVKGQLDVLFRLAEKHGKGLDIHLHDGGEAGGAELRDIAARTAAAGLAGNVVVSHAFALGDLTPASFGTTAAALARAGIAIMTSCPPPVPVPPVKALRAAGVSVFAASDNIRDCWSPFGNGDMLDRVGIVAQRQELFTNPDLRLALGLATSVPAGVLKVTDYGIAVGAPADLVAIAAPGVEEAVLTCPPRRLVVRAGEIVAENGTLTIALPDLA